MLPQFSWQQNQIYTAVIHVQSEIDSSIPKEKFVVHRLCVGNWVHHFGYLLITLNHTPGVFKLSGSQIFFFYKHIEPPTVAKHQLKVIRFHHVQLEQ